MIIQCPACNTSFSASREKFGLKNRKVKCSRCNFIWTANSNGKAVDVPTLYEPISSQGNFSSALKSKKLNLNTKPEHPLPVPLKEKNSEKNSLYSIFLILSILSLFSLVWYNRIILLEKSPSLRPVLEFIDPAISIRGIDINNLETRKTIINNQDALIINGSLINQSKYRRNIPDIMVKLVTFNEKVIVQKKVILSGKYLLSNEQISFSTNFIDHPKEANKVQIELIP